MLTRALAPWLLFAALFLFPSLIAAGITRAQASASDSRPVTSSSL